MGNMSYCRFQNTLIDLQDCADHMDDHLPEEGDEARARERLIALCKRIVEENGGADQDWFEAQGR